jgi:SsrA-binding protein
VKTVAENRRARYEYSFEDVLDAGIMLSGTEVKSLRSGEGSIAESYAEVKNGEVWLVNANIPEWSHGNRFNHEPKRPRKLLLTMREIEKLHGAVARQGMTLVPLSVYFNERGRAKVELAVAKGRKLHDKRAHEKERTGSARPDGCFASGADATGICRADPTFRRICDALVASPCLSTHVCRKSRAAARVTSCFRGVEWQAG